MNKYGSKQITKMQLGLIYRIGWSLGCWMLSGALWAQDHTGVVEQVVAKVSDYAIFQSEVVGRYFAEKDQASGISRCDILEKFLQEKILSAHAELDSLPLSDEEVANALEQRMDYVIAQVGSAAQVRLLYDKTIQQLESELREPLRQQMLAEKMQSHVLEDIDISPREVVQFFKNISPKDQLYYSMEVRVGQVVRVPKAGTLMKQQAYNEMVDLRARLNAGDSFERLAKSYSMDPSVQQNNGTLGFFKLGELDPAYEAAALRLKPGEISKPILSSFGYHLIQLIELRGNTYNSKHILIRPRVSNGDVLREKLFLDSLAVEIRQGEAIEGIAKEHSYDTFTGYNGGFFAARDGSPYVPVDQLDPLLFFTLDSMQVGNISNATDFTNEKGEKALRILYYQDRVLPHEASLEQDYDKIQQSALLEKKEKQMNSWLKSAYEQLYVWIDESYAHCDIYAATQ